ncbi:MAG: sugar kinase [Candidatus Omnitrophica bacterium]|nr:sugar kinase [Candidatus Omnitrophota bacterium]
MSLLVVGSVALDTVKTPFGKHNDILGGSAVYFGVCAAHFTKVNLVAVVGRDFPKKHTSLLRSKGIDLRGLEVAPGKTFRWDGEYGWDFSDAKTNSTHLNVFADFQPKIPDEYKSSKYLFLANIDPTLQENVLDQVKGAKLVACDTMNFWIETKRKQLLKLLKKIDLFFLNESEARLLSGEKSILKAAAAVLKMGPKRIIIKKGEHGSLMFSKGKIFSVPASLLDSVVDPTGAGDTFAGGVMGYLTECGSLSESSFRTAITYGGVMATFAVEDFSLNRLKKVTKSDIAKRLKRFKSLTCF